MKILVWIWNIKNALDLLCLWGWVRFVQPDSICDGAIFVSWHNMITSFDGGPWNCGLEAFRGSLKELQSLKCQQKWKDTVVFYWYLYIYLHSGRFSLLSPLILPQEISAKISKSFSSMRSMFVDLFVQRECKY